MTSGQEEKGQDLVTSRKRRTSSWRRVITAGILCLIIPVVLFITASKLTHAQGPDWLSYSFENPYAYLFSSLLLLDGQAPEYVEHPGTTTQVFGALVLRASSTKSLDDLIKSALRHPEISLRRIHRALLLFVVLSLWVFPWITAVVLRNYLIGLLIQVPTLFYQSVLSYTMFLGSDLMVVPFSIVTVCLCTVLIAPSSTPKQLEFLFGLGVTSADATSMRLLRIPAIVALTGLACAFGIATKLTFYPLVLISLFCCRTLKNLAIFATTFMLGLAVALAPIYSKLGVLGTWIFKVGTHKGIYGTGEVGLPGTTEYLESVRSLIEAEPLIVIIPLVVGIGVLVLSLRNTSAKPDLSRFSWRMVLPLLGLEIISFLTVAKHPAAHYLIPLCISTGLSLVLLFYVLRSFEGAVIRRVGGWVALVGLLFLGFKDFVELTPKMYGKLRDWKIDLLGLYQHAEQITQNDLRVDYFFSDSPEFPLFYGSGFSRRVFGSLLASFYPNKLFLNVFSGKFETFAGSIDVQTVLEQHDHLYFLGEPSRLCNINGLDPKTFETIDQAGNFCLQKWTRK
jgi:hypothetical protein